MEHRSTPHVNKKKARFHRPGDRQVDVKLLGDDEDEFVGGHVEGSVCEEVYQEGSRPDVFRANSSLLRTPRSRIAWLG